MNSMKELYGKTKNRIRMYFARHELLRMEVFSVLCVLFIVVVSFLSVLFWGRFAKVSLPLHITAVVLFCFGSGLLAGWIRGLRKKGNARTEDTNLLNNYMDANVRKRILEGNGSEIGVRRNVAILVADIRDFTSVSQGMSAEDAVNMLNAYFAVAEKCIHEYGGILDNFIGDTVTAIWDDGEGNGDAALLACRAALAISGGIRQVDDEQYRKYGKEVSFGIGIAYGEAILGEMGSKTRRVFTAVGEPANLASKLENKAPRGGIYVSENIHLLLEGRIHTEKVPAPIKARRTLDPVYAYSLEGIGEEASSPNTEKPVSLPDEEKYTLTVFGSRGSYHVSGKRFVEFGGQTTCNIIRTGNHAVVIDCGTGLYEARALLSDCTKIDVLLSHVHYDHCLGLLDWSIFPKDAELNFYGNFRGWLGLRTINELFAAPFWPVDPVSGKHHQIPDWGKTIYLDDDISVRFFPSPHPNGAAIMHMKVGTRTICVMVDCERADGLPFELVQGADLLIYDGMYSDEEYETKQGWGHSTWQEGCRLAKRAGVSRLIITHHNPVNPDSVLLENETFARNIFPNTVFARSGMSIRF